MLRRIPVKLQSILQKALRKIGIALDNQGDARRPPSPRKREEGYSPQTARGAPIVGKITRDKHGMLLALTAAVLAAAALAYHAYFAAPVPSLNEKSIAVLPFADLSQRRDQEYFCDGIQEEILTRLSKIADPRSIFANVDPTLQELAE